MPRTWRDQAWQVTPSLFFILASPCSPSPQTARDGLSPKSRTDSSTWRSVSRARKRTEPGQRKPMSFLVAFELITNAHRRRLRTIRSDSIERHRRGLIHDGQNCLAGLPKHPRPTRLAVELRPGALNSCLEYLSFANTNMTLDRCVAGFRYGCLPRKLLPVAPGGICRVESACLAEVSRR